MHKKNILIVEDDKNIAKLVKYNLEKNNFKCILTTTGEEALEVLDKQYIDLVILDIMLPEMDGLTVLKLIRKDEKISASPVIMLTAKGEEIDKVVGLELGADDYVVKPFSVRELVLRVKAILKRYKPNEGSGDIIVINKLIIDIPRHKVTVNGKRIDLTPIEFKLLVKIINAKGKVLSRDKLLDDIWDISADVTTRTVDTHIKRLRQKLGESGNLIETVRGIGYRFMDGE